MPDPDPSARPAHTLGESAAVNTLDDVAVALCELAWLGGLEAAEQAALDEEIRKLKEAAEQRLQISVGRTRTTVAARTKQIAEAVEAFIQAHPDAITSTGKKTRKFTHGEVSLRSSKLSVAPAPAMKWKDVLDKLRDIGPPRFIVTKYDVDKSRIVDELGAKKIGDEELAAIGLVRKDPHDEVRIKPGQYSPLEPAAL